jgi:hypothetical protein
MLGLIEFKKIMRILIDKNLPFPKPKGNFSNKVSLFQTLRA